MTSVLALGLCVASTASASSSDLDSTLRAHHPRPCREKVVAEAKEVLGAILTAEQVYYQRHQGISYAAVADTADLRALGLVLDEPMRRWSFEVRDVTETSFVAIARGRRHTRADGVVVRMSYTLRGTPVFDVEGCRERSRRGAREIPH